MTFDWARSLDQNTSVWENLQVWMLGVNSTYSLFSLDCSFWTRSVWGIRSIVYLDQASGKLAFFLVSYWSCLSTSCLTTQYSVCQFHLLLQETFISRSSGVGRTYLLKQRLGASSTLNPTELGVVWDAGSGEMLILVALVVVIFTLPGRLIYYSTSWVLELLDLGCVRWCVGRLPGLGLGLLLKRNFIASSWERP